LITINQHTKIFEEFADAHLQIQSFNYGDLSRIDLDKDVKYPQMWMTLLKVRSEEGQQVLRFRFIFVDNPKDDFQIGEKEIQSDQLQIALDLLYTLQTGYLRDFYNLNSATDIYPFNEKYPNNLSGVWFEVELQVPTAIDACDLPILPLSGISINDFVIVRNSDNSYSVNVNCGTTFTLPDDTYNIFVNGVLNNNFTYPSIKDLTINITN
jgi:hypothetical protein